MTDPFGNFAGNDGVLSALRKMILSGRLPHAVILEGRPGSGRRTLARMIARAAACTADNGRPCGECSACRCSENPDIVTVVPDGQFITVAQIREIRAQAYIVPNQSEKRVFIIPDAHKMNEQAQNALLKILEEPPKTVMFILTCEYTHQLLGTVVSRSAVLSLSPVEADEAEEYILTRYPEYEESAVSAAVLSAGGLIGGALALLSGDDEAESGAAVIAAAVGAESELELLRLLAGYERSRPAQKELFDRLDAIFRDSAAVKSGAPRSLPDDDVRRTLARRFSVRQLLRLSEACVSARADCDSNAGGALLLTDLCACFRDAVGL